MSIISTTYFYIGVGIYVLVSIALTEFAYRKIVHLKNQKWDTEGDYAAVARHDTDEWSRLKFWFWGSLLLLLRLFIFVFVLVGYFFCVKIALVGADQDKPISRIRRWIIIAGAYFTSRAILFSVGIWSISKEDRRTKEEKKEFLPLIGANHVSWIDIMVMINQFTPSFVSSDGVGKMPVIGPLASSFQCILVKRSSQQSREQVLEQVRTRQAEIWEKKGSGYPPLVIFPEGTTTNGTRILKLKRGLFLSKLPIQPVCLRYEAPFFHPALDVIPIDSHLILLMCQPFASLSMTILPPFKVESDNWEDDARRFRNVLSTELDIPQGELGFADKKKYISSLFSKKEKQD